ncbi:MAG: UDP-N-acetylglucosamine 3-dehydrogenase [Solirubrobacteraceae bacterium]|jgi:predicted dehydrogenase|nr:UDP-N-acetylglucosamine 3-dehydrogenase [Solirubrobacteraceae bacterium]
MPDELGVAVIGAGQMGAFHINTWERVERARLVAVADPDEHAARACIGRRPVEWVADWRALLERADVDAVVVAVPTELHAEFALGALEAGKHVLVEKPIATTMPDALRMATAARAASCKLMVGHVERFNPAVTKVKELLDDNRLGRVYRAQAVRVGPLPLRIKDAGVAIDLATHDLDIMQHVLKRNVTRVYAEGSRFSHASQEDMLACLLRFGDDGPFGMLDVNWLTPEKRRELTILGEGGMLRASYLTQDVWFVESATQITGWDELALVRGDAEGAVVRFALRKREPLLAELEAFVACVLDDTPEPVSAYDGARALATALAVRESAANNRPIDLLDMPEAPAPPPRAPAAE